MARLDDRWSEIDPILSAALEASPDARAVVVARACGDDTELRALVEALLAPAPREVVAPLDGPLWDALAADVAAGALVTPAAGAVAGGAAAAGTLPEGTIIDRYRLREEIGRGGMAIVYRAERVDGAFAAPVAMKLATTNVLDPAARARFARERRILAEVRHPSIAQILDGGETDRGQPYLVMELVEGEPIDVYADRHRLSVDERLALVATVARAVQHAHQCLVVHRDLKPSNVLVDREGRVKLLDFGIASLIEEPDGTITRGEHPRPLTPAFASPEQLRGDPVTTVSDVYQLGHLLYLLLTGCPPYRPQTDDGERSRSKVTESEPVPPSQVIAREGVRARRSPEGVDVASIAVARRTTPARLVRALAGDLETIVLMALRTEPERRYASAVQLAEDLDRFRHGLPVRAQPDRASYRLRKFVGRHRVSVGAAALFLILLAAFSVTLALQAERIAAERDRARREAETAEEVTRFLLDIFAESAPAAGATADVRALDVVDRAAAGIRTDVGGDPVVRARLLGAIGGLYNRFGREEAGRPLLREAVKVLGPNRAGNELAWAFAVTELATLEINDGYTADEVRALGEVVEIYAQEFGPGAIETIAAQNRLATGHLWTGNIMGARAIHDEAMDDFARLDPSPEPEWLSLATNFATVMAARGDLDRAVSLLDTAYPLAVEADHPVVLYGITAQLAEIHAAWDDIPLLDRFARENLRHAERTFGPDNWQCSSAWRLIARAEHARGRYPEAETAFDRMRSLARRDAPPGLNAAHAVALAELLVDAGRPDQALAVADTCLTTLGDVFGYNTTLTGGARLQRGRAWLDLGRTAAADTTLRSLVAFFAGTAPRLRGHGEALEWLGRVHLARGEADSAVVTLGAAVDLLGRGPHDFWKLARARGAHGRALLARGRTDLAREELNAALRVLTGRCDRYEREARDALATID